MKKNLILYLLLFCAKAAMADHITGGEIYYSLLSVSNGVYSYNITLKLFMVCNTQREFNNPTFVSFFDKGTGTRVKDITVNLANTNILSYSPNGPCIVNPPMVCYRAGFYSFTISLPASKDGYVVASQVIYRVDNMNNLVQGYNQVGATYTAEIPGNGVIAGAPENNSARFTGDDLVVICANNSFSYSFAAKDDDGDKLRYTFCNAYRETSGGFGGGSIPSASPPYTSVPYGQSYTGIMPLGPNVSINENTGMITGIAPAVGTYVISVCVDEIRNNIVIATQRKDIQVTITACNIAAASLLPEYYVCGSTHMFGVTNLSASPLIKTFDWQFTNDAGATIFSTKQQQAVYTFKDTGLYKVQLVINKDEECSDSASSTIKVYPGFEAGFGFAGICLNKPTQFTDSSVSVYGTVNEHYWDFGDIGNADVSDMQNPEYTYTSTGIKNVRLIAADSKGCRDTVLKPVSITDKPPITTSFTDTLICKPDSIQLQATGSGIFTWSPDIFMSDAGAASPKVAPPATMVYYVDVNDNGCLNRDSVTINVTDHVTLQAMPDTTICTGDTIRLDIISNAAKYTWTPAAPLNNAAAKMPQAVTPATTTYEVLAEIGSCNTKGAIKIATVDYPVAIAGNDTMICFNSEAYLHGNTDGSSFTWSPMATLQNANTLNPVAFPATTTAYVLTAYDTKGCPKAGMDTITVTPLPDIKPYAGRDTAVVVGQPLQFHASGGTGYGWFPPTGLSATDIPNPVGTYYSPSEGIRYTVKIYNEAGCIDSAFVTVKVYQTLPAVFVPSGFTPNGDGRNDILKPVAAGMQRIEVFNIYNRWGQLVFSTNQQGKGWDGTLNGHQQSAGTYVWMVKAIDYNGADYIQRGTAVLIR